MAMMSSGGRGYRSSCSSYSPPVKKTYTLEQAISLAGLGGLDPKDVFSQMGKALQDELDHLGREKYGQSFSAIDTSKQRQLMLDFLEAIELAKKEAEKPVPVMEALEMARDGKADEVKLYAALPEELRKAMDAMATAQNAAGFTAAAPELRRKIAGMLVQLLQNSSDTAAAQRASQGLHLHNQALELKAKGQGPGALDTMREAEKILAAETSSNATISQATVGLYCNLSSARACIGDWACDSAMLRAAIGSANEGLRMAEGLKPAPKFEIAVLTHNLGYAEWRLGEVTRETALVARGVGALQKAGDMFRSLGNDEAAKENAGLYMRARGSLVAGV